MKKILIIISIGIIIVLSACGSRVPPSNHIVIGSTRKIYAIDEKGVKISVSPPFSYYDVSAPSSSVQWSPNHKWVVYQTEDKAGPYPHIFVAKADGTEKIELTNADHRRGYGPVWSPDGDQIATYFGGGNEQDGIYIIDTSCLVKGHICAFDYRFILEEGFSPSWSFDGKQLAFLSPDKQASVISIDNPEDVKTISPKDIICYELAWSPVNNEIAASCHDSNPSLGLSISLMDSEGSNFRRITFNNRDISPIWSPDGTKIAFISDKNNTVTPEAYISSPNTAVFLMNNDGSGVKQISPYNNENIYWITWVSP